MSELTLKGSQRAASGSQIKQYWDYLSRYLKPQIPQVGLMTILLLTGIALQLINPQVIRYFLDTAQAGGAPRSLMLAGVGLHRIRRSAAGDGPGSPLHQPECRLVCHQPYAARPGAACFAPGYALS
jgi:hypothetical protein